MSSAHASKTNVEVELDPHTTSKYFEDDMFLSSSRRSQFARTLKVRRGDGLSLFGLREKETSQHPKWNCSNYSCRFSLEGRSQFAWKEMCGAAVQIIKQRPSHSTLLLLHNKAQNKQTFQTSFGEIRKWKRTLLSRSPDAAAALRAFFKQPSTTKQRSPRLLCWPVSFFEPVRSCCSGSSLTAVEIALKNTE